MPADHNKQITQFAVLLWCNLKVVPSSLKKIC